MPKKVLVAVDLSKISEELVLYGHTLGHRLDVQVDFIHALPHVSFWRGYEPWIAPEVGVEVQEIAHKKIAYWVKKAEEQLPGTHEHKHEIFIEHGSPAESIIHKVLEGSYNLLIVGHKGHSLIEHLFIGSTSANVARHAPCSVLIYRPGLEVI